MTTRVLEILNKNLKLQINFPVNIRPVDIELGRDIVKNLSINEAASGVIPLTLLEESKIIFLCSIHCIIVTRNGKLFGNLGCFLLLSVFKLKYKHWSTHPA